MDELRAFIDLVFQHKWIPASAALIFLIVRVLKSSWVPAPINKIPPKVRTLVAVVLGFAGAGLQAVSMGTSWQQALAENLVGALGAILAHDLVIEWLRGGKELAAGKSPPMLPLLLLCLALVTGCGAGGKACAVIDTAHQACTIIRYLGPDGKTQDVQVSSEEIAAYGRATAARRAAHRRAKK